MKRSALFLNLIYFNLLFTLVLAQSPQSFKYQTILRNLSGQPLANQAVRFQVGTQRGMNGPLVYQEQHSDTTNAQGLAILEVGRGALINNSPAFSSIRWDSATHFLALSFDSTGTGNFLSMGSFELLSVPYALYAQSSGNTQAPGSIQNQIQYWNGNTWANLNPGNNGNILTICNGNLIWTQSGQCPGRIANLDCNSFNQNGTLTAGLAASGVWVGIPYSGGGGGNHNGQIVNSTGVTGLTATLLPDTFAQGNGILTYTISGTPVTSGSAYFAINIGGLSCTLTRTVFSSTHTWRNGMVFCGTPTAIVPVTNPGTNKTWMDRNLGASQVATSSTDVNAYGDLYQWGRFADGHQCRNSSLVMSASLSNRPHSSFIIRERQNNVVTYDWLNTPNNNLWQGVNGINNPCPTGYRLPTVAEWEAELASWVSLNTTGAFNSPLKLPMGGRRSFEIGLNHNEAFSGDYHCTTSTNSANMSFASGHAGTGVGGNRAMGYSVRCIQD
jgi:hypothetical protein